MNKFKSFDIIIDDGSHLLSDIVNIFNFFPIFKFRRTLYNKDFKHLTIIIIIMRPIIFL